MKNYLILLDIDNTLITSCTKSELPMNAIPDLDNKPVGLKPQYVFKRPNLDKFLDFLFQNFTVALWSAGNKPWVDQIVNNILKKYKENFLFIWSRENCDSKKIKPLERVWTLYPQWSSENTILIDDRMSMNPENQIQLFPFTPSTFMNEDNELIKVQYTLNCLLANSPYIFYCASYLKTI